MTFKRCYEIFVCNYDLQQNEKSLATHQRELWGQQVYKHWSTIINWPAWVCRWTRQWVEWASCWWRSKWFSRPDWILDRSIRHLSRLKYKCSVIKKFNSCAKRPKYSYITTFLSLEDFGLEDRRSSGLYYWTVL